MNRLFLTAVAGSVLAFSSCTQEEVTPVKAQRDYSIAFRAGVASRVNPSLDYTSNPSTFYVSAYPNSHKPINGELPDSLFWEQAMPTLNCRAYKYSMPMEAFHWLAFLSLSYARMGSLPSQEFADFGKNESFLCKKLVYKKQW